MRKQAAPATETEPLRVTGRRAAGPTVALCALLLLLAQGLVGAVSAQRGYRGRATRQGDAMAQGQASIAVRSDVKVRMKGLGRTTGSQMEAFSTAVVEVMPDVRACYRELVQKRPTTVGAFDITVELRRGGKVAIRVEERGGSDRKLKRCVVKAMASAEYGPVGSPASAEVHLDFDNSRARGQASSNAAQRQHDALPVQVDERGTARAEWRSGDRAVAFRVEARGKAAEDVARVAVRGLRDGFAAFLDCRRRAEKGGVSPAGKIDVALRLPRRGGKAQANVGEVTVESERVPRCIDRAFRRTRFDNAPVGARANVEIQFAE